MAQVKKVKNTVNKKSIDHYSESFKLLRRFRNFLKKDVVTFRQIRLLYMAFSKAAIEKKLDADSKYFDLYKKANDAVVKMYAKADENKEKYKDSGFQIVDTESNIFQKIDELIKSRQIDIGVRLTKRFVSMINTKPDKAKAKRLLNSINNAIKNERIMKDNRLFDQVKHAKAELKDYLNEDDALDPVNYVDGKKASKGKSDQPKKEKAKGNIITADDESYLEQIYYYVAFKQIEKGDFSDKNLTKEVIKALKSKVKQNTGKTKERYSRILKNVQSDFEKGEYLTIKEANDKKEKKSKDTSDNMNPKLREIKNSVMKIGRKHKLV